MVERVWGFPSAKKLIQMMKGDILVNSEEGSGSVFTVWFYDVEVASASPARKALASFDHTRLQFVGGKVLIVDDVQLNRQLLVEFLSDTKLSALQAENGREGIRLAEEFQPDLIVMDVKMPVMNGPEAARKLKLIESTRNIPIIALTAIGKDTELRGEDAALFSGYLVKPVNMAHFFRLLSEFLPYKTVGTSGNGDADLISTDSLVKGIKPGTELSATVGNSILPRIEKMTGVLKMSDINRLAEDLIDLGKTHRSPELERFGGLLLHFGQSFDIANVRKALGEIRKIPDILERPPE